MPGPFTPQESDGRRASRIREIPVRVLIPNLITVLAICAGLSGIRLAFDSRFELAVAMVLAAALLDAVDGRAARMLKASTKFGAQMDSLADIVNFGVAPALVLYAFVLEIAGAFGWMVALIFAIACALRLARFNVALDDPDLPSWQDDYFVGVPAPAGALMVLLPVYLGFVGVPLGTGFAYVACFYTVAIALLMVSRLRVYSAKSQGKKIRRDMVMPLILLILFYVLLLVNFTWYTLAVSTVVYLAFLPFSMRAYAKRAEREAAVEPQVEEAGP